MIYYYYCNIYSDQFTEYFVKFISRWLKYNEEFVIFDTRAMIENCDIISNDKCFLAYFNTYAMDLWNIYGNYWTKIFLLNVIRNH